MRFKLKGRGDWLVSYVFVILVLVVTVGAILGGIFL